LDFVFRGRTRAAVLVGLALTLLVGIAMLSQVALRRPAARIHATAALVGARPVAGLHNVDVKSDAEILPVAAPPDAHAAPAPSPTVTPAGSGPGAPRPNPARRAASTSVGGAGGAQVTLINADRLAAGLPPLAASPCLTAIAAQNAQRMAAQGYISHADGVYRDLGCGLGGRSGENVAYWTGGINDSEANRLFMASPDHRANILGPFRYVGVAWVVAPNGTGYIAEEFS
jgi:uncharacterized protein YkwD